MRKNILISIIAAASVFSLYSCGTTGSSESSSSSSQSSSSTSIIESSSESSIESSESSAIESSDESDSVSESSETSESTGSLEEEASSSSAASNVDATDYNAILDPLLINLNEVDKLGATAVSYDEEVAFTDDSGRNYHKVIDSKYTSCDDIRAVMESVVTDNLISTRYSAILDAANSQPYYIEKDGILYVAESGKGGGMVWTDSYAEISDVTDSSFTAKKEYLAYGNEDAVQYVQLGVVLTDNGWRIDSIEFLA